MKDHLKVLMRCVDTPLLMSTSKLQVITEKVLLPLYLGEQWSTQLEMPAPVRQVVKADASSKELTVVEVYDSLVARNGVGASGYTSYSEIERKVAASVEAGSKHIVLSLDSPGGEVTGLFSLTNYLRGLRDSGIRITAIVDGMATSAAYAIAACATEIYATNTSLVGSIAAIMVHLDQSGADAQKGYAYTFFRSKAEKALGDSHTTLTDEVKSKFQALIDNADVAFNNDVIASRPNLSLDMIISTKGSEFTAQDALRLGLIDKIVSSPREALALAVAGKPSTNKRFTQTQTQTQTKGIPMADETELELRMQLATQTQELAALKAQVEQAAVLATTNERLRITTILDQTSKLGLDNAHALNMIAKGRDTEDSLDILTSIATGLGKNTHIDAKGANPAAPPAESSSELDTRASSNRLDTLRQAATAAGLTLRNPTGVR
jgi:ClpP class serine protease